MTHDTTTATRPHQPHVDDPTPGGAAVTSVPAPVLDGCGACPAADPTEPVRRRAALPRSVVAWHARGRHARTELAEAGMATAEYAIATLAAVGFAGLLVVILKGNEVKGLLMGIIRQALSL
ncbi:hypothetical protein ASE38_08820 [Cellulomonas sp. Root930]|nr:hypothetical protein ASE38_08820 [Cellulomonas sp. Root930]